MHEKVDRRVVDFAVDEHKDLLDHINAVESGSWFATGTSERMYLSQFENAKVRSLAGDIPFRNYLSYIAQYNRKFLHHSPPSKFRAALVFEVGAQFELANNRIFYNAHTSTKVSPSVELAYRVVGEDPVRVSVEQNLYLNQDDVLEKLILDTDVFDSEPAKQALRSTIIPAMYAANPHEVVEQTRKSVPDSPMGKLGWEVT